MQRRNGRALLGGAALCTALLGCGGAPGDLDPHNSSALAASTALPGRLQAEDYRSGGEGVGYHDTTATNEGGAYRQDGVDIQATTDTGGGYNVGWIYAGEWLSYQVTIATAGTYDLSLRMASATADAKSMHLLVDGVSANATFTLTGGSGWQAWKTVTVRNVSLPAGAHVLKLVADSSLFNVNYLDAALVSPACSTAPGWDLQLVENFNAIDPAIWTVLNGVHMSGHAEAAMAANVTAQNGVLRVQAKKQTVVASDGTTENYTGGIIWTKGKWTMPNYFRLEARVKIPWGQGMWPGFVWTRPQDGSDGEIDFFESIGRELSADRQTGIVHQTIHSGGYGATHVQDSSTLTLHDPEGWHTVVFEKTKNLMVWKVDGVETKRVTNTSPAWKAAAFETASKRWFIWINLQLGGSWAGNPDSTTDFTPDKSAGFVDSVCVSVPA